MNQVIIENPVINSPFAEPTRHYKFDDEGITNEIVESRRVSSYFVPIPKSKKKPAQRSLYSDQTEDRFKENEEINRIRQSVARWKQVGYLSDVSTKTAYLLEYWNRPNRDKKLFSARLKPLKLLYISPK